MSDIVPISTTPVQVAINAGIVPEQDWTKVHAALEEAGLELRLVRARVGVIRTTVTFEPGVTAEELVTMIRGQVAFDAVLTDAGYCRLSFESAVLRRPGTEDEPF